jgi:hypothetical protein
MKNKKHDVRVGDRRRGKGLGILVEVLAFTHKGARVRLSRTGKEKNISVSTLGTAYDLVGRLCAHCGTVFEVDICGKHQRMCPERDGDFCEASEGTPET